MISTCLTKFPEKGLPKYKKFYVIWFYSSTSDVELTYNPIRTYRLKDLKTYRLCITYYKRTIWVEIKIMSYVGLTLGNQQDL